MSVNTPSGIEVPVVATREMLGPADLEQPASYPFTRGIFDDGFRGRPWTIRQYLALPGGVQPAP